VNRIYEYIIDKKLYHPIFWIVYTSIWFFISGKPDWYNFGINLIYMSMSIFAVYFNSRILMRHLLNQGKNVTYSICLILLILSSAFVLYLALLGFFNYFEISKGGFFETPNIIGSTLGSVASSTLVLMVVEIVRNSRRTQKLNQQLEKDKLETEVKFLRSQLNPHFLFNALNNIYFLIKKDQDKAADALAQFSEMLRYQLYDCNVEKIPLAQEIDYLHNYIKLASLSHQEVEINVNISDKINGQVITPLLLIPFVENAFKYVSAENQQIKSIDIKLDIENENLSYTVNNSFAENEITEKKRGGIGLDNIQKRLKLLYPNKHNISLNELKDSYLAKLNLEL